MTDTPFPDWEKFPCLDDVISKADVDKKGSGSYSADYVNWCKTAELLRKHAPGWQFELKSTLDPNAQETDVWRAPNGSGYLKGFFRAPTGSGFMDTPEFPQAIMDNRNNAIAWDKISARDVTDTHRRCMCTAAAAHFGLAWQLWAKVEIENPMREAAAPAAPPKPPSKPKPNTAPKAEAVAKEEGPSPLDARRDTCTTLLRKYFTADTGAYALWSQELKNRFDGAITADKPTPAHCTTAEQVEWLEQWIENYAAQAKA